MLKLWKSGFILAFFQRHFVRRRMAAGSFAKSDLRLRPAAGESIAL